MRHFLLVLCGLALFSCTPDIPEGRFACTSASDCPSGWSCDQTLNRCVSAAVDGGQDLGVDSGQDLGVDTGQDLGVDTGNGTPDGGGCGTGYMQSGTTCVDIDECASGTVQCSDRAMCSNTPGSYVCACRAGYSGGTDPNCVPSCSLGTDPDTGSRGFVLTHLVIPYAPVVGFDIDGIDNSSAGGGSNAPGCWRLDTAGGVDNSLGSLANSLSSVLDLSSAIDETIVRDDGTGTTTGNLTIAVSLTRLGPNGSDDACVGVTFTIDDGSGAPQVVTAVGDLVDDVVRAEFASPFSLAPEILLPDSVCTSGVCTRAPFEFLVRGGRVRLVLDAARTGIEPGSMLGGFMFYNDCSGGVLQGDGSCVGGTYSLVNPTGLRASLGRFMTDASVSASFSSTFYAVFEGGRDLHMDVSGALTPCMGDASTTNRNSASLALGITSR